MVVSGLGLISVVLCLLWLVLGSVDVSISFISLLLVFVGISIN